MASAAFNQAQSAQQQQQFQQLQQQALLQSLAGQQQQTGRSRSRRGREDGLPVGSRAPPANAGQSRFSRTGGAIQFGQGNDAALLELATQRARAPLAPVTERIVSARGIQRGGAATGTPISATGEEAVEEFLDTHANCNRESLMNFLSTVRDLGYNLEDIQSAMRVLYDSGALGAALPDLQRRSRWAGGVFAREVRGTRGARGEVPMPSTLWQIANTYCDDLDTVTDGLWQIHDGTFGNQGGPLPAANTLVDQATLDQINAELAAFVASHSQCAANEEEIRDFLALVDASRANGRELFALVRAFGLEGYLSQLMSRSNVRWAGGAFTPATTGVTDETFNQLKRSMLWAIVERYCQSMGPLDQFIANVISGRAAEGLAGPQAGGVIGTAAGFKPNGNGLGGSAGAGGLFGGSANVSRAGSGTFGTRGAGANARPMSF
ncbi:hypothetical protein pdul_cds_333 [Pandoravirus dulcis]|uniref:Uncharacterized protein n=1 Tax=Pandoravirus dulcis TaxID=1349409 RepID=S4VWN7_9VIRU|nr:hypothetical protein pdul_cds_333 [Pandoravirus dulcis]AGO82344.1 hypothetical protein pdul_cds_333 [Pandoravirus dulcis]